MRFSRCYLVVVSTLLVLLTLQAHAERSRPSQGEAGAPQIPPVLYAHVPDWPEEYPVWVSADAAITDSGEVDRSLVPDVFAGALHRLLNDPRLRVDGCARLEEVWMDRVNPPDRSTLSKIVATSDLILRGTVVEKDYGFQAFTPGQLIRVRVQGVIKGEVGLFEYLAFVPVGRFTAGPYRICKTDSRYAGEPAIGDSVLLMPAAVTDVAEPYLHIAEAEGLVVLPQGAKPELPATLREALESPGSVGSRQLLDSIRHLVRPAAKE